MQLTRGRIDFGVVLVTVDTVTQFLVFRIDHTLPFLYIVHMGVAAYIVE